MKWLLFFAFIPTLVNGLAQPAAILHKPYNIQFRFIDSVGRVLGDDHVYTHDYGIGKCAELVEWAEKNGDDELAGELKLLQFKFITREERNDSIINEIERIAIYAANKKYHYLEADALQMAACRYSDSRENGRSVEDFIEAYSIYSAFTPEEFPPMKEYLYSLGIEYSRYGDNSDAVRILHEALNTKGNDDYTYPIYNALGVRYRDIGKYDSAELYFNKIYSGAVARNDQQWVGISIGNIGSCYYLQHKYDEAIPLIQQDIETSLVSHQLANAANAAIMLADIYHKKKNNAEAERILKKTLSESYGKSYWPNYRLAASLFDLLSRIYFEKGDAHTAYLYLDSAGVAKDSVSVQFQTANIINAKERIEALQRKIERQKIDNQLALNGLIRNGLVIAILFMMAFGLLFVNRHRLRQKKLEAEKKITDAELNLAIVQLDSFKQSVQEKNSIIETITNELSIAKKGEEQQIDNETLLQLERSIILTDEQWENFKIMFEKVHKGFLKRVKEKMPDLTPAEMRFVALSKLKLSPKEMASMLGISSNSIRNYRHRLRRKLDLGEDASFEDIADAI